MKISAMGYSVRLKNISTDDADRIALLANDPDIANNIAAPGKFPYPYTRGDALAFIESARMAYLEGEGIHMCITLNDHITTVGVIGIKHIDLDNKKGEIGYWLGKEFWGKGYAKEAIMLMTGFAFSRLKLNKIYANVLKFNQRSISLLIKLGFKKDAELRANIRYGDKFVDELIYSILSSEYQEKARIDVEE